MQSNFINMPILYVIIDIDWCCLSSQSYVIAADEFPVISTILHYFHEIISVMLAVIVSLTKRETCAHQMHSI